MAAPRLPIRRFRSAITAGSLCASIAWGLLATEKVVQAQNDTNSADSAKLLFEDAQTSLIQNTMIAAPVSGVVESVAVVAGQRIFADDVVVQLVDEMARKELFAAESAVEALRLESENDVAVRYARRALEVREHKVKQSGLANDLYRGAVTDLELRELQLEADQSVLAIEQAQHDLSVAAAKAREKSAVVAIAQSKLAQHRIRSRVGGMVTEVSVEPGEWVEAGKPVARVVSLHPLRVECFVDGRAHGRELVGRKLTFTPAETNDGTVYHGTVSYVSPELHPVTGQVRLWATINNPNGTLGSGMPGHLILE